LPSREIRTLYGRLGWRVQCAKSLLAWQQLYCRFHRLMLRAAERGYRRPDNSQQTEDRKKKETEGRSQLQVRPLRSLTPQKLASSYTA
jgi:hypothetical protein